MARRPLPVALILSFASWRGFLFSQTREPRAGEEVYRAACLACHGPEGKGMPRATVGFEPPATFPDFTDCNATTREPDLMWRDIIHHGGPARGFSEIMPAFTEALRADEIREVVRHLRGFCKETGWPRGELNLPRALATEKAFPEDEVVVTATFDTRGPANVSTQFVYERRFGRAHQLELKLPFSLQKQDSGSWFGGVGDVTLGYKRLVASSLRKGSIFSLAGEATLPAGDKSRGFGNGVTILEGFAAYGQLLPRNSFLQLQSGFEAPTHDDIPKAVYWRAAVGKSLAGGNGFERLWSPMVELVADRELEAGAKTNWDVVPEFQVTLSQRQHIRANFGVRIPVTNTASRPVQVVFYLLWDWFDGGLRDGWRKGGK